jgi:hypothetical protein
LYSILLHRSIDRFEGFESTVQYSGLHLCTYKSVSRNKIFVTQATTCGCTGCECEPLVVQSFAPVTKPNRTRGSGAAKFRSKSLNLGTQLPGVPLSGAKENTYFATAPARNLHDKQILLGKWPGAGASTSSPGHFYEIRTLITSDVATNKRSIIIIANSYARILGVYKNIMPTYSSYLRFF